MSHEPVAYLNGRLLPYSHAKLSLHDAGFVYGATVTDRLRTFRGEFFHLDEHLIRFIRSCKLANVPLEVGREELTHIACELQERNGPLAGPYGELAFVLFATPGPLGPFAGLDEIGPPTFGMYSFPLDLTRFRPLFENGARLAFSERSIPPECIDPAIKHRSRLAWWLAETESGPASALLVTPHTHFVRETPAANFLAVRQGVVVSPPRAGVLEGVALGVVEELCSSLDIPFEEREITAEELTSRPGECLLTCSSYGVVGVSFLGETACPWPGPVFERLLAAYGELVGLDLRAQILSRR